MAEPPSPSFVLKKSAESITDLNFWDTSCYSCPEKSSYLIAGYSNKGGIDVWNLTTRRVQTHYPSNHGIVSIFGTENGEIISLNREGELKVIDAKSAKSLCNITVPNVAFCKASCLLSSDGDLLVAVTGEETASIAIWDSRKEKLHWRLCPGEDSKLGMVMCIKLFQISSGQLFCLAGYEDGSLILWHVMNEILLQRLELYKMMPIMCFDFSVENMCGVAGSPSEILTKFGILKDNSDAWKIDILKTRAMKNSGIADIKLRGDSKIVSVGGWGDGSVRIFSLKTLKLLAVLKYHDGTVQSVAFKHDPNVSNQILASGSETHKIAIWKIYND